MCRAISGMTNTDWRKAVICEFSDIQRQNPTGGSKPYYILSPLVTLSFSLIRVSERYDSQILAVTGLEECCVSYCNVHCWIKSLQSLKTKGRHRHSLVHPPRWFHLWLMRLCRVLAGVMRGQTRHSRAWPAHAAYLYSDESFWQEANKIPHAATATMNENSWLPQK